MKHLASESEMARKKPSGLTRPREWKAQRRVVKLYCEGEVTERQYFEAVKRLPVVRNGIAVEIRPDVSGSSPLTLVSHAMADLRETEVDERWCVFDIEAKADRPGHHPNLAEAKQLAAANNIRVAVSNPCFELWLALHHVDHTAHLTTTAAIRMRKTLDGSDGKEVDGSKYVGGLQVAAERAAALDRKHRLDGTFFPHDNPSSGVYRLLSAFSVVSLSSQPAS
jgi:RloB-like protein